MASGFILYIVRGWLDPKTTKMTMVVNVKPMNAPTDVKASNVICCWHVENKWNFVCIFIEWRTPTHKIIASFN